MAFPQPTPSHAVPGAFLATPAVASRFSGAGGQDTVRRRLFQDASSGGGAVGSVSSAPSNALQSTASSTPRFGSGASATTSGLGMTGGNSAIDVPAVMGSQVPSTTPALSPVAKAAGYVNDSLQKDSSYPELDQYCRHISSEYDTPSADSPWAPFQRTHMYNIPDAVLSQYNRAEVSTMMGLFAELNHAWVTIDNCLYLWDYTHPNPELVGYEESPHSITAVKLVPPKPGVFLPKINHILVVATTSDMFLLGVAATPTPSGATSVELYATRMSLALRSTEARVMASTADGRIFFAGQTDSDVYEMVYQQEERWFSGRTGKKNHSNNSWSTVVPNPSQMIWRQQQDEQIVSMVVDDSRNLLYALTNTSTVRTYFIEGSDRLTKVIEKTKRDFLRDIAHALSINSPLLNEKMKIVSVSPVSSIEDSKVHLMALTDTGCRLFMSATSASSYMLHASNTAPQSMQLQAIKFPPTHKDRLQRPRGDTFGGYPADSVDVNSQALVTSRLGARFAPGYFLDFVQKSGAGDNDLLFISSPDSGRIKNTMTSRSQMMRYYEQATWIDISSKAEDIGLISKPFAASSKPVGFGNELAVQFDDPEGSQFAILTNTGIHVIRRRRLVEIFASAIRSVSGDEGLKSEMNKFQSAYGRVETITCALAVACSQGIANRYGTGRGASEQNTLDRAKQAFIVFGGNPTLPEQDGQQAATIDTVRPSSRHAALSLYLSRLIRSLWKSPVIALGADATGAMAINSVVSTDKLRDVQEGVEGLRRFLNENRAFIQGLSGPADLQRANNQQEELAFQGEHQAMHSLEVLMTGISEGISFVTALFDERVADIFARLDDSGRQQLRDLTYEQLFSQSSGKELAKVLVKAIVNRNIENGSNVETVADALRRKCGSFCSPDDVVIFKAQEQLKRASEPTSNANHSRMLLHESLKLFQRVAGSLTHSNLETAISQYISLRYYAGAIQLCLTVAGEKDRGNSALSWVNDGKPAGDPRAKSFEERQTCYELIHRVLLDLDIILSREPEMMDGKPTLIATKRAEAYDIVNNSTDEVFHFDLYDWYIQQDWTDRLLQIDSHHVTTFLQRLASDNLQHAELLCRFYTMRGRYFEAAKVQYELAVSDFAMGIKDRLSLLGRAKTNASVMTTGVSRQEQQLLNHQVTELLEIANIQDSLLDRLLDDGRIPDERREEIVKELDGSIQGLSELFNNYADQAGYYDLCLLIYHVADYRNAATIAQTWNGLIEKTHEDSVEEWEAYHSQRGNQGVEPPSQPYAKLMVKVQEVCHRSSNDSFIFPVPTLLRDVCGYAYENGQDARVDADVNWPVFLFLNLGVSYDLVVRVLEQMFESQEVPFRGPGRARVVEWICFAVSRWAGDLARQGPAGLRVDPWVTELMAECESFVNESQRSVVNEGGLDMRTLLYRVMEVGREIGSVNQGIGNLRGSMGFY